MSLTIRPLHAHHMPAVDSIQREAYSPELWERITVFEEKLNFFPDGCWLGEVNSTAAGYLLSHPARLAAPPALNEFFPVTTAKCDCYFIHDVAVRPAFRGTGVGAQLAQQALGIAAGQGLANVALVSIQNSLAYWQRFGFEPVNDPEANRLIRSTYGEAACYMFRTLG